MFAEYVLFLQILHNFHYYMNENCASNYHVGISLLFQVCFQIFFFFWGGMFPVIHKLSVLNVKNFLQNFKQNCRISTFFLLYLLFDDGLLMLKTWTRKLLFTSTIESSSRGRFQAESEIAQRKNKKGQKSIIKLIRKNRFSTKITINWSCANDRNVCFML